MSQNRGDVSVSSMLDIEESRISGHDTSLKDTAAQREQFQATRRWNMLLSRFFKEMPRKTHRRIASFYPETFTGKESVDYLLTLFPKVLPNKPFDKSNAERFMQLLLTKNLIENPRDEKMITFCPKATLYRFCAENMALEIKNTGARSNSLTSMKRTLGSSKAVPFQQSSTFNRRISSSYSNLQNLVKASETIKSHSDRNPPSSTMRSTLRSTPEVIYETIPETPRLNQRNGLQPDDFYKAWKEMLLAVIGRDSIVNKLAQNASGTSIQWNSTQIGRSGVVIVDISKGDLSNDIKKNFKKLAEWTPSSEESPDGIYQSLYTQLCCISPIIRDLEARALADVWTHFKRLLRNNLCYNPSFSNDKLNNHINGFSVSTSTNPSMFSSSSDSSISPASLAYIDGTPMRKRDTRAKFYENIAAAVATPSIPSTTNLDAMEAVTANSSFRDALQILLLDFTTTTRRRLNIVCRFISKISKNEALILHGSKSKLDFLCETLACIILDSQACHLSLSEGLTLVKTMVTYNQTIFAPSQQLIECAEQFCTARTKGTAAPSPAAYCRRINNEEYKEQMTNETKSQLLELLDNICYDENLSQHVRKKKLESFRKTYPDVYKIRYPDAQPQIKIRHPTPTGRLVNKIRTLTRRDSAKRT